MPTIEIAPGLTLTDSQYEIAADGIAQHTPELPLLSHDLWTSTRWTLVPDELTGRAYKAVLVLDPDALRQTIVTLWFEPDLRGGADPKPHNHPFDFHSRILTGSYVEDRYVLTDNGVVPNQGITYQLGDLNEIGREDYHEVVYVEPGKTITLMQCGPGMNSWGHLNLNTGEVSPNVQTPRFRELLRELNPHQGR